MGRHPIGEKKYQITHFWGRHKQIVRLHVQGYSNVQIAEFLGVTPQTVSNTLNSRIAHDQIQNLNEGIDDTVKEVAAHIQDIAPRAVQILEEMMEDESVAGSTRARIADRILDRAGHMPTQKVQNLHGFVPSPAALEALKKSAKEAGIVFDNTEEVPYEEVVANEATA